MAEQDFEIKIRINADTSQVEQVRRSFQQLGAQVQVTNLQQQRAQAAAAAAATGPGSAAELGRLVGQITGVGLAGGIYAFISSLKNASAEIVKISESLDKQGEQLVKHAQLYDEQARHAQDAGDVLKVSDATLKDIEATQKTFNDLSQKQVGIAAQISDYLQKQLLARQRAAGLGDYEAAQQQNVRTALDQLQAARQRGMDELLKAEAAQNETYDERREKIESEIAAEEKRKQAALDNTDPGGYAKAGNNLVRLNKLLDETIKLEAQRQDQERRAQQETSDERAKDVEFLQQQVQSASPQAQRILQNEMAAQREREAGRDASQFERSAEAFKRGATPEQLGEAKVLQALLEQNKLMGQLLDAWR